MSDIHTIILKAIDIPLEETSKVITGNQLNLDPSLRSIDLDAINHRQDVAHSAGMQETSVPNLLDKMYLLNCSSDDYRNGNTNYNYRNNSNVRKNHMQKNVNQAPTRLYNFLDHGTMNKNAYNRQNSVNHVHESIQKQFVSPYHRYESRNKN